MGILISAILGTIISHFSFLYTKGLPAITRIIFCIVLSMCVGASIANIERYING